MLCFNGIDESRKHIKAIVYNFSIIVLLANEIAFIGPRKIRKYTFSFRCISFRCFIMIRMWHTTSFGKAYCLTVTIELKFDAFVKTAEHTEFHTFSSSEKPTKTCKTLTYKHECVKTV